MAKLTFLEAKINEHCNYKCVACFSYGNIAKKEFYPIEQFNRDLKRVGELFDFIPHFSLIGGEPLLNPDICDYMSIARRYLPASNIHLITNGVLLSAMDENFFKCASENKVKIHISKYSEKRDEARLSAAVSLLEKKNIDYFIQRIPFFHISKQLEQNPYKTQLTFDICRKSMECINLYKGMIYHCARPFSLKHYDEHFGTSYAKVNDGIPLHDPETSAESILLFLSVPGATCQYCTPNRKYIKWQQGQAKKEDWQIISENQKIIVGGQDIDFSLGLPLDLDTFYFDMNDLGGKEKGISMSMISILKDRDVYVWIADLKAIWLFEALYLYMCHVGVNITGIVASDSRIKSALDYIKAICFEDVPSQSYLLLVTSDEFSRDKSIFTITRKLITKGQKTQSNKTMPNKD